MSRPAATAERATGPETRKRPVQKTPSPAELPGADDDPKQAPRQEQEEREALKRLRRERREGR